MFKIGLVGLPNAGKSTLFNFLTKGQAQVADYSFTTIEPNIGIMPIKDDKRASLLKKIFNSQKIFNSYVKFWDIAGLIKGAHKGQGLGNKFLSYIREVDALCYVVNGFYRTNYNSVKILQNFQDIQMEIILADAELLQKYLQKRAEFWKNLGKFTFLTIQTILQKALEVLLKDNKFIISAQWSSEELIFLQKLNLLSTKKVFVVINVADQFFIHETPPGIQKLVNYLDELDLRYMFLPIHLSFKLQNLSSKAQEKLRIDYNYYQSGYTEFTNRFMKAFALSLFYTCGPKETRGWLFYRNTSARDCAGLIHTDFVKNFIRVEIIPFATISEVKSLSLIKQKGQLLTKGADHKIQDGDVCHFLVNK